MRFWLSLLLVLGASVSWLAATVPSAADPAPPRPGGFWKEKTGSSVNGEFGGEDPVGLASGKHIPTNCAIHHAFDEKTYCFSSLPSLEYLDSNRELLGEAKTFWAKEHPAASR